MSHKLYNKTLKYINKIKNNYKILKNYKLKGGADDDNYINLNELDKKLDNINESMKNNDELFKFNDNIKDIRIENLIDINDDIIKNIKEKFDLLENKNYKNLNDENIFNNTISEIQKKLNDFNTNLSNIKKYINFDDITKNISDININLGSQKGGNFEFYEKKEDLLLRNNFNYEKLGLVNKVELMNLQYEQLLTLLDKYKNNIEFDESGLIKIKNEINTNIQLIQNYLDTGHNILKSEKYQKISDIVKNLNTKTNITNNLNLTDITKINDMLIELIKKIPNII